MTTGRKLVWKRKGRVWRSGPWRILVRLEGGNVGTAWRLHYVFLSCAGRRVNFWYDGPKLGYVKTAKKTAQKIQDAVLANVGVKP